MSDTHWQPVADLAARLEAEGHFSGILHVSRAGQVVFESCHGMANRADGIPVRPTTRFGTASLSKLFTAVAVLDAAGRGEVGLQDSIVDVLPPDKRPGTLRPDVTVHHLLTHTSGIADYFEEDEDLPGHQEDYAALWQQLPNYTVRDDIALLPLFADLPPVCPPGKAYHYSNAGYVLLGILLAHVSGLSFTEAVSTRVFAPAGMRASGYPALDEAHPDVATGYLPPVGGGPWRSNIFSVPAVGGGDGGAVVTARDVATFLRAVHRGGVWRGVTPELVLTERVAMHEGRAAGYGVELRTDGSAVFGKDGGDPGVAAVARHLPASGTSVVLLANTDWDTAPGMAELANLLIDTAEWAP
ncbi:serine hydrolase domain-containing protein [Ornithinimicrobium cavernae]|uniref:serine hydrolase domain-containing protein n=1 Tax=Ornithinimicrobium cavernae TaxID=2666047 RepID=UPI001379F1EA|nr:serine hydrolase domain-containing protein [Ornithinimicrobium cavernae]